MAIIHWICPKCGEGNLDDDQETAFPMCSECSQTFTYEEITEDGSD